MNLATTASSAAPDTKGNSLNERSVLEAKLMSCRAKLSALKQSKQEFDDLMTNAREKNAHEMERNFERIKLRLIENHGEIIENVKKHYEELTNKRESELKSEAIAEYENRKQILGRAYLGKIMLQEKKMKSTRNSFTHLQNERSLIIKELVKKQECLNRLINTKTKAAEEKNLVAKNSNINLNEASSQQLALISNWNKNAALLNEKRERLYIKWEITFSKYKLALLGLQLP